MIAWLQSLPGWMIVTASLTGIFGSISLLLYVIHRDNWDND